MKKLTLTLTLLLLYSITFSQTKYFLDRDNNFIDSTKANSYMIVFEKAKQDSVYRIKQFTMKDELLVSGSFKDETLSIFHGEFSYYEPLYEQIKSGRVSIDKDERKIIGYYLDSKGSFFNGKKNGLWIIYFNNGKPSVEETFVDDVLNGKVKQYTADGNIYLEGQYKNNLKDGEWTMFNGSSIDLYKEGKLVKSKNDKAKEKEQAAARREKSKYNQPARPFGAFNFDLRKFMSSINYSEISNELAEVVFNIDEKGKILDPMVRGVTDVSIRKKIVDYFLASPNWFPATEGKEKTPVWSRFIYRLKF